MRILLALDGSPCSAAALREVIERSWPAGTEVEVLSVAQGLQRRRRVGSSRRPRVPGYPRSRCSSCASASAETGL